jgi:hypothetical protein
MITIKYLVINHRGNVTVREREPRMAGNEVALRLELNIPDKLFQRPVLEARMSLPAESIPSTKITPKIVDNIEKIVKEATGLNIAVNLVAHPEEEKKK